MSGWRLVQRGGASGVNEVAARFSEKHEYNAESCCWEWRAAKNACGYGRFKLEGRNCLAHRVSYLLHNGSIPDGLHVLHRCDNRGCVNPGHLFLGTHQDNMADMNAKGRHHSLSLSGEKNGASKLSEDDVQTIRRLNRSQSEIARRFGVSQSLVSQVQRRVVWTHVQ